MSSQAAWLPLLLAVAGALLALLAAGVVTAIVRTRVRHRMAGIDRRLDHHEEQLEALRVPQEIRELETLLDRGEASGRLSPETAAELRRYAAELAEEHRAAP